MREKRMESMSDEEKGVGATEEIKAEMSYTWSERTGKNDNEEEEKEEVDQIIWWKRMRKRESM